MVMRLDVITMISESTPRNFVNECRRSVKIAVGLCPYAVNMIESPGVPGHIGRAMLASIEQSTAEYLAWVDDDDFVLPNAFACLHRHFAAQPSAICAREFKLMANGSIIPSHYRHHLTAFHRDVIDTAALAQCRAIPNQVLLRAVESQAVDEFSWVYAYRVRRSAAEKLRSNITAFEREHS